MTKDYETCSCLIGDNPEREHLELGYLLGKLTTREIAQAVNCHEAIVKIHMKRHIPLRVVESLKDYLPSVASMCAEMLVKVKSRATDFLDKQDLEDKEIRLLTALVGETNRYLDKLGQLTGEAASINTPIINMHVPNNFEEVVMEVLPKYPEAWKEIRDKLDHKNIKS